MKFVMKQRMRDTSDEVSVTYHSGITYIYLSLHGKCPTCVRTRRLLLKQFLVYKQAINSALVSGW